MFHFGFISNPLRITGLGPNSLQKSNGNLHHTFKIISQKCLHFNRLNVLSIMYHADFLFSPSKSELCVHKKQWTLGL